MRQAVLNLEESMIRQVANAGMGLSASGSDAGDPTEWEQMIGVNVLGVLWTAMAAMPHLKKQAGHLLLTGSAAGCWRAARSAQAEGDAAVPTGRRRGRAERDAVQVA